MFLNGGGRMHILVQCVIIDQRRQLSQCAPQSVFERSLGTRGRLELVSQYLTQVIIDRILGLMAFSTRNSLRAARLHSIPFRIPDYTRKKPLQLLIGRVAAGRIKRPKSISSGC